jgi:hypothetical protein
MKAITAEWVAKAEDDFALLVRESRVRKHPAHDAICFHAQQCAEKYLKARLSAFAVAFRYPGESADRHTVIDAIQRCRRFRKAARAALRLDRS